MQINNIRINWLKHAAFKISDEKIMYIDPFNLKEEEKADIILITHPHYDHCSIEDIKKVLKDSTIIVAPSDCVSKLTRFERTELRVIQPNSSLTLDNIQIETFPAYNTNKQFHPKENNWLGYILTIDGKRIYHAGDSDLIPEMSSLKNIDVALIPIGGTYTMNEREAAEAVNKIKPKIVIPMHYNTVEGTKADVEKFKSLVDKKIEVKTQ